MPTHTQSEPHFGNRAINYFYHEFTAAEQAESSSWRLFNSNNSFVQKRTGNMGLRTCIIMALSRGNIFAVFRGLNDFSHRTFQRLTYKKVHSWRSNPHRFRCRCEASTKTTSQIQLRRNVLAINVMQINQIHIQASDSNQLKTRENSKLRCILIKNFVATSTKSVYLLNQHTIAQQ